MKRVLNQLIQLQELYFAESEQQSLNPETQPEEIEKAIHDLLEDLPSTVASLCRRLRKRDPAVVVPVVDGVCSACGMALPTSRTYAIERGDEIYQCPSCSRILYSRPGAPRQVRSVRSMGRLRSGIARFSDKSLMCPRLKAKTRNEALSELIGLMARKGFVENPDGLLHAALEREAIISTAVNHGLAFPHVRGVEGGGLTFSVGLKREGLDFGAPDGGLTRIIFFIVIPSAASAFYLQLLSGLIESLQASEARERLLECTAPDQLWEALSAISHKAIP
ncbi:MAG: PTS sugar transporter subunit IIA [Deltaproteobacteria bacterium]|nr:PTS sugar transporter subunit IIA [Deltaproteobacteria bacterium]